jgi:hypothetical protein
MTATLSFAEARSLIRSGDAIFFEPRPWPETPHYWLVRTATGHTIVHVGVAMVRARTPTLIESDIPEVQMHRLEERLPCWWLPLRTIVPAWQQKQVDAMMALRGKPYGYLDAVRLWLGLPLQDNAIICTELVMRSLLAAGVKVGGLRDLMPEPLMHELARRAGSTPILLTE